MGKQYLDNEEFHNEIIKCKQNGGQISNELLDMFRLLIRRLNRKNLTLHPELYQDFEQTALIDVLLAFDKYDPERTQSAFAFFSSVITFGLAKGYNTYFPKKYKGTIRINFKGDDDKELFNI